MFNGNYTDYRDSLSDEAPSNDVEKVVREIKAETAVAAKKKIAIKEKKEYELLEKEIQQLELEKTALTEKLNTGLADHLQLLDWSQQIKSITENIERKTARWVELSEFV